jgi:hypothetical protein
LKPEAAVYRHAFKSAPHQSSKRRFQPRPSHPCEVTAVFDDHVQSFSMKGGATMGELSERLAVLGSQFDEWLVAINIKLGPIDDKAKATRVHRPAGGHAPRYVM